MCMKLGTFWEKKEEYPTLTYYWNYCIRKTCLLKRLKGLDSAHHSLINVLTSFETLLRLARLLALFLFFHEFEDKLSGKKSALVTSEIFRLFVNTLTPDDKYSPRNMQIFLDNNFKRLYLKKKWQFFLTIFCSYFWNVHETWEHFERKEEYPSPIITEIIASERDVYLRV